MNQRLISVLFLLFFAIGVATYAKASSGYVPNPDSRFYEDELSNIYHMKGSELLGKCYHINKTKYEEKCLEVIKIYSEIMEIHPNDPIALFNRGTASAQLGDYEKAIEDYNAFLLISPGDGLALENRGRAYELSGDLERAYQDYTRIQNELIKMEPRSPSSGRIREVIDEDLLRIGKKVKELRGALE